MKLFGSIEKLINEHGSATILKERMALANDKYLFLEDKVIVLEDKIKTLGLENETLRFNLAQAEDEVRQLNKKISIIHNDNSDGYVCDYCGSANLNRTGSRPDPTFGEVGIKQKKFTCNECNKNSYFTPDG